MDITEGPAARPPQERGSSPHKQTCVRPASPGCWRTPKNDQKKSEVPRGYSRQAPNIRFTYRHGRQKSLPFGSSLGKANAKCKGSLKMEAQAPERGGRKPVVVRSPSLGHQSDRHRQNQGKPDPPTEDSLPKHDSSIQDRF